MVKLSIGPRIKEIVFLEVRWEKTFCQDYRDRYFEEKRIIRYPLWSRSYHAPIWIPWCHWVGVTHFFQAFLAGSGGADKFNRSNVTSSSGTPSPKDRLFLWQASVTIPGKYVCLVRVDNDKMPSSQCILENQLLYVFLWNHLMRLITTNLLSAHYRDSQRIAIPLLSLNK